MPRLALNSLHSPVSFELVAFLLQLLESRDSKHEQLCLDFDATFPRSEHTDGVWLLSRMNSFPSWTSTPLLQLSL